MALLLGSAAACLAQSRDAMFDKLADRYFNEVVFRYSPEAGTQAGFHQYDPLLGSGSRSEIQAEIGALRGFEAEVAAFDPRGLSAFVAADRELLLSQIRGQLLELETIRPWEKNPDLYSSGAAGAIFVIMSRNYAPPAERLKSVIARERLILRLFQSARENLSNPPRVYTEVALEQVPGIAGFFQNDVPAAFKQVTEQALLAEFHQTNQAVIEALQAYQEWMKKDLLPRPRAIFASAPKTIARSCCTTKWWIRRSTGCSPSDMRTCATTRSGFAGSRPKSTPNERRSRFSKSSKATTRRPAS